MTTVLDITADPRRLRGRGALSNAVGRYERETRVLVDDGWNASRDDELPPLKTEVLRDSARTIITRNQSPDISFDQSINPYKGCEHGCIYCFARPTHAYLGLSPGADFESKIFAKPNAAELLARELSAPGYVAQGYRDGDQHRSLSAESRNVCASRVRSSKCFTSFAIPSASFPSRR
jgi:hypothetical protein